MRHFAVIAIPDKILGVGLYSTDEAAMYARVNTRTMTRWIFGDGQGEPVIDAQFVDKGEKLVTFLDFVQTLAIRSIRLRERNFPLQKIRIACENATSTWKVKYPLASKNHRIFLFGPPDDLKKCDLVISLGRTETGEEACQQITGKKSGNRMITTIAEPFMRGLRFGNSDYAESYVAWERDGRQIIMDPHVRFGEPYLPSCGYTAISLWEAYQAEGGIDAASRAYGVDAADIDLVCGYYDYLKGSEAVWQWKQIDKERR